MKIPRIKKRFTIILSIILYIVCKLYVIQTPDPHDDKIPDQIRDTLFAIVFDNKVN